MFVLLYGRTTVEFGTVLTRKFDDLRTLANATVYTQQLAETLRCSPNVLDYAKNEVSEKK